MMYAKKIKMKSGCGKSENLEEIDEIYIDGCKEPGFYKKALIHDAVTANPGSIKVYISPYPDIIPAISRSGEKYVKSSANQTTRDNLLALERE